MRGSILFVWAVVYAMSCSSQEKERAQRRVAQDEQKALGESRGNQLKRSEETLAQAASMKRKNDEAQARAVLSDRASLLVATGLKTELLHPDRKRHCNSVLEQWRVLGRNHGQYVRVPWSADDLQGWCLHDPHVVAACLYHVLGQADSELVRHIDDLVIACRSREWDGVLERREDCKRHPDWDRCRILQ